MHLQGNCHSNPLQEFAVTTLSGHTGHNASTASISSTQSDRSAFAGGEADTTSPPTSGSAIGSGCFVGNLGEEFIEPFRVIEQGEVVADFGHVELPALGSQQRPDVVEVAGA